MYITVSGNKKEVKNGLTLPELIELENVEMPEEEIDGGAIQAEGPAKRDREDEV